MSKDKIINIGRRKIQKLGRIAIGKSILEEHKLQEGDLIENISFKKVK